MLTTGIFQYTTISLSHHSSSRPWLSSRRPHSFCGVDALGPFRLSSNPTSQVCVQKGCYRKLEIVVDEFVETGCSDLPVEFCLSRNLEPVLTLRHAVDAMMEALNMLKLEPPCSKSGVLRFQVLVPPSIKALDWLCSQNSLDIFPQHYLALQIEEQSHVLTNMIEMLGVSGVGAAISFRGSSHILKGYNLMERYLSLESPLLRTYGFTGVDCNMKSNLMDKLPGSFYFFIPQIELNEFENCSLLASNLVWDVSLSFTFEEAIQLLEGSLHQVSKKCYFRNSTSVVFNKKAFALPCGTNKVTDCANINMLWASLIVEECVRLGLTYFCIAPGSRSSPLTLSACRHPLATCTSCYDERSLAFHALGYARGSNKPAVVITSSGTAVSNLFPAVVEASQDFIPLLLLTADRPPELQDAGANQAIDQINHFGKYVRFFFNLPPPTDEILARMVLTTIDSAVYNATQSPCGPVHINCPFREPLDDVRKEWSLNCLKGLDLWMLEEEPFTKYIKVQYHVRNCHDQVIKVLDLMQNANRGLLLVGVIHTDDEIWAVLLLSKYLSWPIVADVLSGLRLRNLLTSCQSFEDDFLFLDHLDRALLSQSVKNWLQPDVVVQIGSRITSKLVGQFLEFCSPFCYIFVNDHPYRHDPSHLVTHRVQSSIVEFADIILATEFPERSTNWGCLLKELNTVVAREISFHIHSESLLTEPYVAHSIGDFTGVDTALFLGNSMAIRDVDMYGKGWMKPSNTSPLFLSDCNPPFKGMLVSGNRGASGIDGVLSTSIGFAVGCNKRVLCVVGDISFLHDTNGLAILSNRMKRKPMTVIVINNQGGAIFSLLPIAVRTEPNLLNQYFYTSHDISIGQLCMAHGLKHLLVQTKMELRRALWDSQQHYSDCIVEVKSGITNNAMFHSIINKFTCQAVDQVLEAVMRTPMSGNVSSKLSNYKILKMEYSLYRIQLSAPPTTAPTNHGGKDFYREGFVIAISLDDNNVGYGEIAPTEIHKEDLLDVEEQLRFLVHVLEGAELSCHLPFLRGSFSHWIWKTLGIPNSSIFPSVRFGMEMAILNALARRNGCRLSDYLGCQFTNSVTDVCVDKGISKADKVPICALVDCHGTPKVVTHVVSQLFHEGFTTVKLKVARRVDPMEDAAVISEIRKMLGYQITIRVDANRKWTYNDALLFGSSVKCFALQYIEEPVCFEADIIKFCEETGLPVALDETLGSITGEILQKLENFVHPGIVAVVLKPSILGGFEKAAVIAKWAQMHEKMAIISSTFESSLGLSAYINFAHCLEKSNSAISEIRKMAHSATIAHGLGTFQWLKEDLSAEALKIRFPPNGSMVEASLEDVDIFLQHFQVNQEVILKVCKGEDVRSYKLQVKGKGFSCSFKLLEAGGDKESKAVIFLHGFLGSSQDWIPLMKAMSSTTRCISIDLPGHGESCDLGHTPRSQQECYQSIESVAEMLLKLICDITTGGVILVGYSMGGRIALHMSLKYSEKVDGAVIISGSPGVRDEISRRVRTSQDNARASYLLSHGLNRFLEIFYEGALWKSLRDHPHFKKIVSHREKHQDIKALAQALIDFSTGRQRPLWEELKHCKKPLLLIVGEKDEKFRGIAEEMCREIRSSFSGEATNDEELCEMVIVPECGHAVHLENPLPVINAVRKFLTRVNIS
ncbi:Protein PHYLLO, chloroplastic [Apostasia shenzhenica]|uniref:Protein PHYLLO, chloroplastic n=1 Tax=Apostasia shenzhenica TaxID=1088818 RepID=A0A2I0ABV9_9ASPA|nr:Protein PHYLLO, chloroplastic [Apostasia shenzhenica]